MRHSIRAATCLLAVAVTAAGLVSTASAQRRGGNGYPYTTGKEVYEHICQGCHMPDAKGAQGAGAYPALAGDRKLQAPLYPVMVILRGQKAMPSFSALSDEQVAGVVTYIRTNFGNNYAAPVTPEQVKGMRPRAVEQNAQRPG